MEDELRTLQVNDSATEKPIIFDKQPATPSQGIFSAASALPTDSASLQEMISAPSPMVVSVLGHAVRVVVRDRGRDQGQ